MTAINVLLGVISITGGLILIVVLLAFVVASWINQPPSKQHLPQLPGEETLGSQTYPLFVPYRSDGAAMSGYDKEGS